MNTKTRPPGHVSAKKHVSVTDSHQTVPQTLAMMMINAHTHTHTHTHTYTQTQTHTHRIHDLKQTKFNKEVQAERTDKRKRK